MSHQSIGKLFATPIKTKSIFRIFHVNFFPPVHLEKIIAKCNSKTEIMFATSYGATVLEFTSQQYRPTTTMIHIYSKYFQAN